MLSFFVLFLGIFVLESKGKKNLQLFGVFRLRQMLCIRKEIMQVCDARSFICGTSNVDSIFET